MWPQTAYTLTYQKELVICGRSAGITCLKTELNTSLSNSIVTSVHTVVLMLKELVAKNTQIGELPSLLKVNISTKIHN